MEIPLYRERGGGWIGKGLLMFQGTWPFAVISIYSDRISLKVAWKSLEIKLSDVLEVKRIFLIPLLADGIQIRHKNHDVPSLLIFWSLGRAGKIKGLIESNLRAPILG